MAREPKGFSKSASGAYTAEDVSYAKQVKQQLAEIIQLQRDGADYDKARLKEKVVFPSEGFEEVII